MTMMGVFFYNSTYQAMRTIQYNTLLYLPSLQLIDHRPDDVILIILWL